MTWGLYLLPQIVEPVPSGETRIRVIIEPVTGSRDTYRFEMFRSLKEKLTERRRSYRNCEEFRSLGSQCFDISTFPRRPLVRRVYRIN